MCADTGLRALHLQTAAAAAAAVTATLNPTEGKTFVPACRLWVPCLTQHLGHLPPRPVLPMSLPYYDLAVSHTLLEPQTQRERVSQAIKLGWDAVGVVHQAAAKLSEQADRCSIRPVELQALLSAAKGVREALAAAEQRGGRRHGDPYSVRQLTRINIPADDAAAAQAWCCCPLTYVVCAMITHLIVP